MSRDASHLTKTLGIIAAAFFILLPPAFPFQVKQGKVTMSVTLRLPKGYEFTKGAPSKLECTTDKSDSVRFEKMPRSFDPDKPYKFSIRANPGQAIITLKAVLYYCDTASKMCLRNLRQTSVTIEAASAGATNILYVWRIDPSKTPLA